MESPFPPGDPRIDRFNQLSHQASELSRNLALLHDRSLPVMGFFARRRARKAIALYKQCIEIFPGSWQSHWLKGKLHQVLNEHAHASAAFDEAARINPTQPDVLREAAISAADIHDYEKSLRYAAAASAAAPDDAGLVANLALAQSQCGRHVQAIATAEQACRMDPADEINQNVLKHVKSKAR
ncbi:MAG: tetratricopeptide repeat protein [Phycisphaerales bacterium]